MAADEALAKGIHDETSYDYGNHINTNTVINDDDEIRTISDNDSDNYNTNYALIMVMILMVLTILVALLIILTKNIKKETKIAVPIHMQKSNNKK